MLPGSLRLRSRAAPAEAGVTRAFAQSELDFKPGSSTGSNSDAASIMSMYRNRMENVPETRQTGTTRNSESSTAHPFEATSNVDSTSISFSTTASGSQTAQTPGGTRIPSNHPRATSTFDWFTFRSSSKISKRTAQEAFRNGNVTSLDDDPMMDSVETIRPSPMQLQKGPTTSRDQSNATSPISGVEGSDLTDDSRTEFIVSHGPSRAASAIESRSQQNGGPSHVLPIKKEATWFSTRRRRYTETASESSEGTIRPAKRQSATVASSRDPTSRPAIPDFLPPRPTSASSPMIIESPVGVSPQKIEPTSAASIESSSKVSGSANSAAATGISKKGWFGLSTSTSIVMMPDTTEEARTEIAVALPADESAPNAHPPDLGALATDAHEIAVVPDVTQSSIPPLVSASTSPPSRGWFGTMIGGTPVPSVKGKEVDPLERPVAPQVPTNFISEPQSRMDTAPSRETLASTFPLVLTSIAPALETPQGHGLPVIGPPTSTLALNSAAGRFTLGFPLLARGARGVKPGNSGDSSLTTQSLAANLGSQSEDAINKARNSNLDIDDSAFPSPTLDGSFQSETNGPTIRTAAHPPPVTNNVNLPEVPATKAGDDRSWTNDVDGRSTESSGHPDDTTPREIAAPWWSYFGLGGGPTAPPQPVTIVQTPAAEDPHAASTTQSALVDHGGVSASGSGYAGDLVPEFGDPLHLGAGPRENAGLSNIDSKCGAHAASSTVQPADGKFETDENQTNSPQDASQVPSTLMSWMGPLLSLAYPTVPTIDSTAHAPVKTEAELFKEATLRTSSSGSPLDVPLPPQIIGSEAPASSPSTSPLHIAPNPVVTHAQTKSWVSFFSSRNTLAVKRVTSDGQALLEARDMEVMDIPDELDTSAALPASPPRLKTAVDRRIEDISHTPTLSKTSPTQSRASSHERGRAALKQPPDISVRKENVASARAGTPIKSSPGLPSRGSPLLSSASSVRTNSPGPSFSGGKSGGKKQNAVLPTFGDTFFTLPRVMVPPTPSSSKFSETTSRRSLQKKRVTSGLTKKTLNVLSSWFPSYTAVLSSSATQNHRAPSQEMLEYLEERRLRIERSWLGKSYDPSSSTLNSPSSTSLASHASQPSKPQQPRFAIATGSGSEHSARAASLLGISAQQSALGRIAPKGHAHLNSSQFSTPSAIEVAKSVGTDLPRAWDALETGIGGLGPLSSTKRAVVIGIHGWFPGTMIRTVLGEPTGTSSKLASMMAASVESFVEQHSITLDKLTIINLEGEGKIAVRVAKLYQDLLNHPEWVEDLHNADVVFVSTHSQGSIVSTHLLASLIADGHIRPIRQDASINSKTCSVVCLAMCGIHLGPLLYLNGSLTQPYFTYFESAAARELFEFQDTASEVSQRYNKALSEVLSYGVKMVYIASVDDQVVPIYSGTFMTASHPLILRALYIDGEAFKASEFIIFLLVLLISIRNAGLADSGLITHLSEATAGSLSGVGHSTPYLSKDCYDLAVRFLFETTGTIGDEKPELRSEPFQARATRNDYEIPWALRGVISDPAILSLFGSEIAELRRAFDDWSPKTAILKDLRRKLEPIQSLRILPTSPLSQNVAHTNGDAKTPSSRL